MTREKLQEYVEKTKSYLRTTQGKANWFENVKRSYTFNQNIYAAIVTACRLRNYENISNVTVSLSINFLDDEWRFLKE